MAHSTHGKTIWLPTRLAILARDGWRCLACRRRGTWRRGRRSELELDHVVPGRGSNPANLVTLCAFCNNSKGDRTIEEWRPELLDEVLIALSSPIDRKLGRALARELAPRWVARESWTAKLARRAARDDVAQAVGF